MSCFVYCLYKKFASVVSFIYSLFRKLTSVVLSSEEPTVTNFHIALHIVFCKFWKYFFCRPLVKIPIHHSYTINISIESSNFLLWHTTKIVVKFWWGSFKGLFLYGEGGAAKSERMGTNSRRSHSIYTKIHISRNKFRLEIFGV